MSENIDAVNFVFKQEGNGYKMNANKQYQILYGTEHSSRSTVYFSITLTDVWRASTPESRSSCIYALCMGIQYVCYWINLMPKESALFNRNKSSEKNRNHEGDF